MVIINGFALGGGVVGGIEGDGNGCGGEAVSLAPGSVLQLDGGEVIQAAVPTA